MSNVSWYEKKNYENLVGKNLYHTLAEEMRQGLYNQADNSEIFLLALGSLWQHWYVTARNFQEVPAYIFKARCTCSILSHLIYQWIWLMSSRLPRHAYTNNILRNAKSYAQYTERLHVHRKYNSWISQFFVIVSIYVKKFWNCIHDWEKGPSCWYGVRASVIIYEKYRIKWDFSELSGSKT